MFRGLDHLAIVVRDTEEALTVWRDRYGFALLFSEVVQEGSVRLTHLDLGNTHLQLVEPLAADHPLQEWLARNGPGLHHFCLRVGDVGSARDELSGSGLADPARPPHQGTRGQRALFLDPESSGGVAVEITGA